MARKNSAGRENAPRNEKFTFLVGHFCENVADLLLIRTDNTEYSL